MREYEWAGGIDPSECIGIERIRNCDLNIIRGMVKRKRSRSPVRQTEIEPQPKYIKCV